MAKKDDVAVADATPPLASWDTIVKLGAIDEANYCLIGAVVVAVNTASGEVTLRSPGEKQPFGRSHEAVNG